MTLKVTAGRRRRDDPLPRLRHPMPYRRSVVLALCRGRAIARELHLPDGGWDLAVLHLHQQDVVVAMTKPKPKRPQIKKPGPGRPRLGETRDKPWIAAKMSRATWYRRQKEKTNA